MYAGVALGALVSEVQPYREPPLVAPSTPRRSSSCTACVPAKVRRAFPATSDISGEFRFHSEGSLVVLFSEVYLFAAIHHRLLPCRS
jgi:hypothetical protein